jgi:hypothetical protein
MIFIMFVLLFPVSVFAADVAPRGLPDKFDPSTRVYERRADAANLDCASKLKFTENYFPPGIPDYLQTIKNAAIKAFPECKNVYEKK